jgi:hypothetical protein
VIDIFHLAVNLLENNKFFIIKRTIILSGGINSFKLNQPGNIREFDFFHPHCPDPGGTAGIGIERVDELSDFHIQYIGKDLAPDIRLRATSNNID